MPRREVVERRLNKPLQTSEYVPVRPYEQEKTWSGPLGYGAKRYLGGPVSRGMEAFQQTLIYAPISYLKGTLPDEWNMGSPWARVLYPARYPRIREAAITGSENPWLNLAVGLSTDPFVYFGGAATQLGKANKLVKGLEFVADARRAELGVKTLGLLDEAGDVRSALKLALAREGKQGVRELIKDIAKGGKPESFEPIIKGIDKYGESVFDPAYRMSEQIRMGRRNVLGMGAGVGLGRVTDLDVMGRLREPAARAWERYEAVKQGTKVFFGATAFDVKPQTIEKVGRTVESMPSTFTTQARKMIGDETEKIITKNEVVKILLKQPNNKEKTSEYLIDKWIDSDDFVKMKIPIESVGISGEIRGKAVTKGAIIVDVNKSEVGRYEGKFGTPPDFLVIDGKHRLMEERKRGETVIEAYVGRNAVKRLEEITQKFDLLEQEKTKSVINYLNNPNGTTLRTMQIVIKDNEIVSAIRSFKKGEKTLDEISKTTPAALKYIESKPFSLISEPIPQLIVERNYLPQFEELTREMREAVGWTAAKEATRLGRAAVKDITDKIYEFAKDPESAKKASRAFALAIRGKIAQYPAPAARQAVEAYNRLMSETIFSGEARYKEFEELWEYIPRHLSTNEKGSSLPRQFMDYLMQPARNIVKRYGLQPRRVAGQDEFVTVTSTSHYGRAVDKWESVDESIYELDEAIRQAEQKGDHKLVSELLNAKKPIAQMQKIIANGIPKEMSPHEINELLRNGILDEQGNQIAEGIGKYMEDFMNSKSGRRWGFKQGQVADDFNFFEEDFRKFIPQRILKHTDVMASGGVLTKFLKRFSFMSDPVARVQTGNAGKVVDELGIAEEYAKQHGGRMVNVVQHLSKRMGITPTAVQNIIGKIAGGDIGNLHMEEQAADAFGDLLKAWEKLPADSPAFRKFQTATSAWAKLTLFGGRASYVFNNLVGDRWNMFLAGASHPKYQSGTLALQVMLPEGRVFPFFPFVKGASDDTVLVVNELGEKLTKRQLLDEILQFDIDGGLFGSPLFETMDKKFFKGTPEAKEMAKRLAKGELTAPAQYMAQLTEKNGRYGLYMSFRERGYHPAEASQMVARYLFDYSKQDKRLRAAMPFYWWTANNIPTQFRELWMQPAKFQIPSKVQWAMESRGKDPTEQAKPDYYRASGVYYGEYNIKGVGKRDIYVDLSNVPSYAAQEAMGLLDTEGGIDAMLMEAAKRGVIMTSPYLQLAVELGTGRDIFTGQKFVGGGGGAYAEKGTPSFMGFNIIGNPTAQMGAQISKTLVTPLDMVDSLVTMAKKPSKRLPPVAIAARYMLGAPIRQVDRNSAQYINVSREYNMYRLKRDAAEDRKDRREMLTYQRKMDKLKPTLDKLTKALKAQREREER